MHFPLPFSCINSRILGKLFFVTLLSVEYKVKRLHWDLLLPSANWCFCNSHWHGCLAPTLPPVLSLAYRSYLTACQPLGSDSILLWYSARKCSKTSRFPDSDGYKIAGRLLRGGGLPGTMSRSGNEQRRSTSPPFPSFNPVVGSNC